MGMSRAPPSPKINSQMLDHKALSTSLSFRFFFFLSLSFNRNGDSINIEMLSIFDSDIIDFIGLSLFFFRPLFKCLCVNGNSIFYSLILNRFYIDHLSFHLQKQKTKCNKTKTSVFTNKFFDRRKVNLEKTEQKMMIILIK